MKKTKEQISLSVVIPVFNEENIVVQTLRTVSNYLINNKFDYEIIVVDDGSTDKSNEKIMRYILSHMKIPIQLYTNAPNYGKGYSVTKGLSMSTKEYTLITDCDQSTEISEIKKLLPHIKQNNLVIGSRWLDKSHIKTKQSLLRRIYSRLFNRLVNAMFSLKIHDTQVGFKLYDKIAIRSINECSHTNRWCFDVEHLLIMKRNNLACKEVAIIWSDKKPQKATFRQVENMFTELIHIKNNDNLRLYG